MGYSANPFQAYIFKSWSFHSADIGWFGRCNHQPFLCFSALLIFKCKLDRRPSSMSSLTSSSSSSSVSSLSPVSLLSSSIDLRDNKSKRYVGGVEVKLCKPQLLFLPCIRWLRASFVRSETELWPQRRIEKNDILLIRYCSERELSFYLYSLSFLIDTTQYDTWRPLSVYHCAG